MTRDDLGKVITRTLFKKLILKDTIEKANNVEVTDHLGHDKHKISCN